MHFGLFNLLSQRDASLTTAEIIADAADQVRVADQLGFEIAWFAEHHFSNYSVCPSPLIVCAHMAGFTKRIKLGTAIVILPLYEPARLLGEIGLVDNICGGRLVLGIGSGYQPFEFDRFHIDIAEGAARSAEMLEMIENGLGVDEYSFSGKFYQLPLSRITPKPIQKPHPEIWVAGTGDAMQSVAASKNYIPIVPNQVWGVDRLVDLRAKCDAHYAAAGNDPKRTPFSVLSFCHVTTSRADASAFADNCRFQHRLASSLRRKVQQFKDGFLVEMPFPDEPPLATIEKNLIIGDVDTCIERCVEMITKVGIHHLALFFRVGGFDRGKAMRSLETFGSRVIPGVEKVLGPLGKIGPQPLAAAAE
ncbi:MAG: LLM class flavin-dependent oxidoreductase [Alphaproteobacteria bacterium]|nr:LLM class flavin-dependent oxidoreductase [Alphaproteobacteria bacterium]